MVVKDMKRQHRPAATRGKPPSQMLPRIRNHSENRYPRESDYLYLIKYEHDTLK